MGNADLAQIINSNQVQERLRHAKKPVTYHCRKRYNPLRN
jgi:hypothetical protein